MKDTVIHFTYGKSGRVSFRHNLNILLHIFRKPVRLRECIPRGSWFNPPASRACRLLVPSHLFLEESLSGRDPGSPDSSSTSQGFNSVQIPSCRAEPASLLFLKGGWPTQGLLSQIEGSYRAQKLCKLLTGVSSKSNTTLREWEDSVSHRPRQ